MVAEEREMFKDAVLRRTRNVCCACGMGGCRRNSGEWLIDEFKIVVVQKRRGNEEWLRVGPVRYVKKG